MQGAENFSAVRHIRALKNKTRITKESARPFGPHHSSLSAPLHENTTHSSVANAPGPNFLPPRRLPRGLGHAALDSDHAECEGVTVSTPSLGILRSVLGIGVTYEMRNISRYIYRFFETFRVFSSYHSGPDCAKIRVGHRLKS